MPYSLRDSFNVILPHLSHELVPPTVQADIGALTIALPPVPWGGFECRLAENDAQVDFHQGFDIKQGHVERLLQHIDRMQERAGKDLSPVWKRIYAFCQQWADPTSLPGKYVDTLILEFDINSPTFQDQAPSVFVQFNRDISAADGYAVTQAMLQTLWQDAPSASLLARLEQCFLSCTEQAQVSHIGLMLARQLHVVRVNVRLLKQNQIDAYMQSVGWTHSAADLNILFAQLIRYVDRIIVCLDVGDVVYPRIGLECTLDSLPTQTSRYTIFLNYLVKRGLCTPEKAKALEEWIGITQPPTCTVHWPGHLLRDSLLQHPNQFSTFKRYLSHIKIDYDPNRDLAAKGYLGYRHHWLNPTKSCQETPADLSSKISSLAHNLDKAIHSAVSFLLQARNQGGWWRDFEGKMGGSDEWVTAYAATALAALFDKQAQKTASDAWNLLLEHRQEKQGWGYNVFLPADSDGTAWALRLATALGIKQSPRLTQARAFLAQHTHADGSLGSYLPQHLVGSTYPGDFDGLCAIHACVTAAAAVDTFSADARRYLRTQQQTDGCWHGYWWEDHEYTTALAVQALVRHHQPGDKQRIRQAVQWARKRIDSNGAVFSAAHKDYSAFATALCAQIWALADRNKENLHALVQAVRWLIRQQQPNGSWMASARMLVPPTYAIQPDAFPEENAIFVDERRIFTTATVLTALRMSQDHFKAGIEL